MQCRWFDVHGGTPSAVVKPGKGLRTVASDRQGFLWISLQQPSRSEMDLLGRRLGLDPMVVEDAVQSHQRPKAEFVGDTFQLVMKTVRMVQRDDGPTRVKRAGEVQVILGERFVVTVRQGRRAFHGAVQRRLEAMPTLVQHGPVAVLHAVADLVADEYLDIVDRLSAMLDEAEEQVFDPAGTLDVDVAPYLLRRRVLRVKHVVVPLIRSLDEVADEWQGPALAPDAVAYLRDVLDHLHRARDQVLAIDDLVLTVLSMSSERIEAEQGDIFKGITAWAAVIAIPTMVTTLYGMNFESMPLLASAYGFWLVMVGMVVVCLFVYARFRRAGWM